MRCTRSFNFKTPWRCRRRPVLIRWPLSAAGHLFYEEPRASRPRSHMRRCYSTWTDRHTCIYSLLCLELFRSSLNKSINSDQSIKGLLVLLFLFYLYWVLLLVLVPRATVWFSQLLTHCPSGTLSTGWRRVRRKVEVLCCPHSGQQHG